MVKIEKKLVQFSSAEDTFGIIESIVNSQIAEAVEILNESIAGISCAKHPDKSTIVAVSGNLPRFGNAVSLKITKYCCSAFKDTIKPLLMINLARNTTRMVS